MPFQPKIQRLDSIDSTNLEALRQAKAGAPEGLCIVARTQTRCRGRLDRTWQSPPGAGLYMSLLLRPEFAMTAWPLITLMAALAVYESLMKTCDLRADIKWPNDILVDEKKICGILSEMIDTPSGHAIVLGIGINLRDADPELNATSIDAESQFPVTRREVIAAVHEELAINYERLPTQPSSITKEWSHRSSYFSGKEVSVDLGNGEAYTGTTCGLEESGALRVRLPDGSLKTVHAGDVTRLRKV